MNFKEYYLLEREDIEKANKILKIINKIYKWIREANYTDDSLGFYKDENNYYTFCIRVGVLDKKFSKLLILFRSVEYFKSEEDPFANYRSGLIEGVEYQILTFNILDDSMIDIENHYEFKSKEIIKYLKKTNIIYHEISHFVDDLEKNMSKRINYKKYNIGGKLSDKSYYGHGIEQEAYWNQLAVYVYEQLKKEFKKNPNLKLSFKGIYEFFISKMSSEYKEYLEKSDPDKFKQFKGRVYSFYNELKQELENEF